MINNKFIYCIFGLCLLFIIPGCRRNEYVMSRDKMEKVLYDIYLAQAVFQTKYSDFNTDGKKEAVLNSIFEKHGITKEILDSSLVWYSDNIGMYLRVNDSVISRLKADNTAIDKRLRQSSDARTLLDSRAIPPYYSLTRQKPYLSFNIDSTTIKKENTSLIELRFDVLGIDSETKLDLSILFEYADTSVFESATIDKAVYSVSKAALPDKKLVNISGYIYAHPLSYTERVLLYNLELMQDSSKILTNTSGGLELKDSKDLRDRPISMTDNRLRKN